MDELIGFLKHPQATVRQQAATHVHGLTGSPDGLAALKTCQTLVPALARLTGDVQSIAQSALSALINLAEVPELIRDFETCAIVNRLAENLHQEGYALMQLDIILLANLTSKSDKIVNDLLSARGGATLLMLANALKDDVEGKHESLDCVTNIITNVARSQPGRVFLQNKEKDLVKGLLEQIYSKEPFRRRGMLLFLSNLLFNKDMIAYLTAPGLDYANKILTLVTGESVIKHDQDEEALCTILKTLCTLAANVRGRNELKRIKALERIKGLDILELPEGKTRTNLLELLDILEDRKVAVEPGGDASGQAKAGQVVALDREKMAADGVSFIDGKLVQSDKASAPTLPAAAADVQEIDEKTADLHIDASDSDGEEEMGLD